MKEEEEEEEEEESRFPKLLEIPLILGFPNIPLNLGFPQNFMIYLSLSSGLPRSTFPIFKVQESAQLETVSDLSLRAARNDPKMLHHL
jgi:hypothetical protein